MKKLFYLISALFFLAGCSDDNEIAQLPEQGEHYLANMPAVVYASIDEGKMVQGKSRTFVEGQHILWHKGDAISFFGDEGHNCQYVFNGEDGTAKADFERKTVHVNPNVENLYSHAVYPYSSHVTSKLVGETHQVTINFPTLQTYAPNSFGKEANIMVAAGTSPTDEELFFLNACGYLVINLYGGESFKVQSIELTSLNESDKLSGTGTIAIKNGAEPVVMMSDGSNAINMVSLDCSNGGKGVALSGNAENPTQFWFALPPVKMEKGFRITVTDIDGHDFEVETGNPVEIIRNEVQPMEAIRFTPATHKLTYTTKDGKKWEFNEDNNPNPFDAEILSHEYNEEAGCFEIITKTLLSTINKYAFTESGITSITFPAGLTTIETEAFKYCDELAALTIPGSITYIHGSAFLNCGNLKFLTFEPSLTEEPLTIPINSTMFPSGPFHGSGLQKLDLNREIIYTHNATDDRDGLFGGLPFLRDVVLGPQVKKVHTCMFYDTDIEEITIPGTVNLIEDKAFYKCYELRSVTFEPSPTQTPMDIMYAWEGSREYGPFRHSPLTKINLNREMVYKDTSGNHFIPNIGAEGMFRCESVEECVITLGEQLETISPYMFYGNAASSITIPDGVKYIQDYAFSNAEMNSITISGTVKAIGDFVFDDCENLSKVTFENGSEPLQIGFQPHVNERGPFFDSPLTYIYLDRELKLSDEYAEALDDWDEGVFAYDYWNDESITTEVSMQGNVKTIHPYMFSAVRMDGCWIPKEVTSIGDYAFYYCEQLGHLTMGGATPPALGEGVFEDCDGLKYIYVPFGSIDNYKNHAGWNAWKFSFSEWK